MTIGSKQFFLFLIELPTASHALSNAQKSGLFAVSIGVGTDIMKTSAFARIWASEEKVILRKTLLKKS